MKSVRIGNGCGFWGDNLDAPLRLAETGRLDYLTLEYLAELTMSILAVQKHKDSAAVEVANRLGVPIARLVARRDEGAGTFVLEFPSSIESAPRVGRGGRGLHHLSQGDPLRPTS